MERCAGDIVADRQAAAFLIGDGWESSEHDS